MPTSPQISVPSTAGGPTLRLPAESHDLTGFRAWAQSLEFPETGRIDFMNGSVEVDMSPEDLYTHGVVKTLLAARLHSQISDTDRGHVFVDRTRITCPEAGLSVEPDVVVVLWSSLESGRVQQVPPVRAKGTRRFVELQGAPDLIVEILSDSSEDKDTRQLPRLYAHAGIPELWLVDARGEFLSFHILTLDEPSSAPRRYRRQRPAPQGWLRSTLLDATLRLRREPGPFSSWRYFLDIK